MRYFHLSTYFPSANPLLNSCIRLECGWSQHPISNTDFQQAFQMMEHILQLGITRACSKYDRFNTHTFDKTEQVFSQLNQAFTNSTNLKRLRTFTQAAARGKPHHKIPLGY